MKVGMIVALIILGCAFLAAVVSAIVYFIIQSKLEKHFTVEKMKEYEETVKSFLKNCQMTGKSNPIEIAQKAGFTITEVKSLPTLVDARTLVDENEKIIELRDTFSFVQKKFNVAHELAHYIQGEKSGTKRESLFFGATNIKEQICDYIAAIIMLPTETMKNIMLDKQYTKMDRQQRKCFVEDVATEQLVTREIVQRRIAEVEKIYPNMRNA